MECLPSAEAVTDTQFWRILIHPFAFANSIELLMGEILLYNVGVGIER